MKVIGYEVIEQSSKESLKQEIRLKIKEGWTLQGGVSTSSHQDGEHKALFEVGYLQAMVKYKY